ncbi:MAG: methylisocitrate lyase [Candidatus Micrarchaeota archaeon]|nr:methylisocitrate lyase [Candidatus Micrarchaeota archaeon]MDE1834469.1 methylisocitrate lyase [Candidatus Micrarchaeota archaeon]MDE1859391.1 methylisocitrate lyase [Candidatus Micrarchaeota archaeon]
MSMLKDNVNMGPSQLRRLIKKSFVVAPGVFDGISAILAQQAGFKALYLSGSAVAGKDGLPDLSVTTLSEVAQEARNITAVSRLPLIVDVDTGFGEAINVIRTIRVMEATGAAGIHMEDQELPKKCGQLSGKKLVSEEEMVRKVRAAVETRKNDDFLIIARTDARAVEGLEGAIDRGNAYVEAGADMVFPEALESAGEFETFAKKVRAPLLANMTEFGKSPLMSGKELGEIGYKIIIFPLTGFRSSLLAMKNTYSLLNKYGTQREFLDSLMTRDEFYKVIGYSSYEKEDLELYKGKASKRKP